MSSSYQQAVEAMNAKDRLVLNAKRWKNYLLERCPEHKPAGNYDFRESELRKLAFWSQINAERNPPFNRVTDF